MDALRAAVIRLLSLDDDHRHRGLFKQLRADEELVEKVNEFSALVSQGRERSERLRAIVVKLGHPQQFGDDGHPVDHALDILERVLFGDNQST